MAKKILLTCVSLAAWFLPVHLALLALLVFIWGSAMIGTANTAKTRALEQRVNAVVQNQANYLPLTGGTVTGPTTFTNNVAVDGTLYGNGGVGGNLKIDAFLEVTQKLTCDSSVQATYDVAAGRLLYQDGNAIQQVTGAAPFGSGVTGTTSQLTNAVNAIIGALVSSGIFA